VPVHEYAGLEIIMSDPVIDRVREFAVSLLPSLGLELYDIQFRREGRGWVLRLIIDSSEGISLDDCSRVSREMSDFLDVEDLIDHAYNLEVSSPGIERELRSIAECERFLGEKIRVKLNEEMDGQRVYVGELKKLEDTVLFLMTEEGKTCRFSWDTIKKARLTL
jgi:ribosome maturation factor RimP